MTSVPAFLLERDLSMSVGTRELPDPGPDEALLEVEWAGLCGSDLHVMRTGDWVAEWPATLGHEIFGRVAQAPAGSDLDVGAPVVADSRIACGVCAACLRERSRCLREPGLRRRGMPRWLCLALRAARAPPAPGPPHA